jgi:hypothetical protein
MKVHFGGRLFLVAAVLGAAAVFAIALLVALGGRSVVAGPAPGPTGPVPSPGHAWIELQDHGVSGSTYWLGTTDNNALELRVNNERALRLEPSGDVEYAPNLIGGYGGNSVTDGVVGATIAGGGAMSWGVNSVTDSYGTVGGGRGNQAGSDDGTGFVYATVGGGYMNDASGLDATVGGGAYNSASGRDATVAGGTSNTASSDWATAGGGYQNLASGREATVAGGSRNTASDLYATVGGGRDNTSNSVQSVVGGGYGNTASRDSATVGGGGWNTASGSYATVGGGGWNTASRDSATVGGGGWNTASRDSATVGGGGWNTASGSYATVGGGYTNTASGFAATVPGGYGNTAAAWYAFAAGRQAKANHDGAFVWADSNNFDFASTAANEFSARATGGARFVSAIDGSGNPTAGVQLAAGGGSWSSISDRNLKDNFTPVDGQAVLASLADIPIATWNYKAQDAAIRHMGPVAQDFSAAFGLGESETAISTVDADGVALAAIQGLYQLSQEQAARIQTLEAENAQLQQQIDALDGRVTALEQGGETNGAAAGPLSSSVTAGSLLFGGLVVVGLALVQRRRAGGQP